MPAGHISAYVITVSSNSTHHRYSLHLMERCQTRTVDNRYQPRYFFPQTICKHVSLGYGGDWEEIAPCTRGGRPNIPGYSRGCFLKFLFSILYRYLIVLRSGKYLVSVREEVAFFRLLTRNRHSAVKVPGSLGFE